MNQLLIFIMSVLAATQVFAIRMGGISGGGGGTIESRPVGIYSIESILQQARFSAFMFFNSRSSQISLKSIIAQPNERSASEIVQTVKIFVNPTGPCRDADGNEVDGSIYSPEPNTICISSYTLGKKLNDENAFSQTLALVVHEYSHLVGASEKEAESIQELALQQFNRFPKYKIGLNLASRFVDDWIKYPGRIPKMGDPDKDRNEMAKAVLFLNMNMASRASIWWLTMLSQYDSLITPAQQMKGSALASKWEITHLGVTVGRKANEFEIDLRAGYDKAFGGRKEVKVSDFEYAFYGEARTDTDMTVIKIESKRDVMHSLNNLSEEWKALLQEILASQDAVIL